MKFILRQGKKLRQLFAAKGARLSNQTPEEEPLVSFTDNLNNRFEDDTPERVIDALQKMGLPLPEDNKEFLSGWEGNLIFLNKYGLVIRIDQEFFERSDRINSSPWIVRPIASIQAGEAVIEICPGGHQETERKNIRHLEQRLQAQGINFWDNKFSNVARLPIRSEDFPEGMTVVIDRGGVEWMKDRMKPVRKALVAAQKAIKAQDEFYAPLRQAFAESYPDAGKMQKFWDLCEKFVQQEKLVAGWNEPQPVQALREKGRHGNNAKTPLAAQIAKRYEARVR